MGEIQNGDIVDVYSQKWRWLGAGFYNDHSKLRVHIVSRNPNDRFDESFWERRIRYAIDYRIAVMGEDLPCCRLVFGESDGLPGLTVDRFEDILVTQCVCYGMEQRRETVYPMLVSILREKGIEIRGVYERNDLAVRSKEGLPQTTGFFWGSGDGHVTLTWITLTVRRPDTFWIRNTTGKPSGPSRKITGYWTALPTPVPLP